MIPKDRKNTVRQDIAEALEKGPMTVRAISQAVGVMEKEVPAHLESIEKSLKNHGRCLKGSPFRCLSCGYEFKERKKFSKPGKCPECRNSHIENAVFWVTSA
jgi:predicted Zn-ribbon and HTH transcriptional regulator